MVYRADEKNARYINGQKFEDWLHTSGSNSLRVLSGVNLVENKVLTEADLVNLREQHNNKYYHGDNTKRGSVQIYPESCLINLFEKADRAYNKICVNLR